MIKVILSGVFGAKNPYLWAAGGFFLEDSSELVLSLSKE